MSITRQLVLALMASSFATGHADSETFVNHKVVDTNGTGHLAISYLLPNGWKAKDTLLWHYRMDKQIFLSDMEDQSPDGSMQVRFSPEFFYSYNGNSGKTYGPTPPAKPSNVFLSDFKMRNPGIQCEVISDDEKPVKPQTYVYAGQSNALAIQTTVKLRFVKDGVSMIEKAAMRYESYKNIRPMPAPAQPWIDGGFGFYNVTVVVGPEKEFPRAMKIAGVMLSSRQMDPIFYQSLVDVTKKVVDAGVAANKKMLDDEWAAWQRTRAARAELAEENRASFQAQMHQRDVSSRDFCDYILDQKRYRSPDGTTFILPSGYNQAILNKNGTITVTTDPTLQPGIGGQTLQAVKRGED